MRRSTLRKSAPDILPADRGRHSLRTRPYDPLPDAEADRILDAALTLLAEIGCRFEPGGEAHDLLIQAGCEVDPSGVVRIPRSVTRAALESSAKSVRLWNRDGAHALDIDKDHT